METKIIEGLGVALITPFDKKGEVDYDALRALLDFQIEGGVDFITVLGTTAETPCLTVEEKENIKNIVVEKVNKKIPIVLGFGGNCTRQLVDKLKTTNFDGVDALLVVAPFYNKPTQEGIYQHYKAISEASPLPIILYNVPGRTGVNIEVDTTIRIANDFDNVIAIKEASGNIQQIEQIIKRSPKGFTVLSGDDGLTSKIIEMGGVGVISVLGNAYPQETKSMIQAAREGDMSLANAIDRRFEKMNNLLFVDGNPAGVKVVLKEKGIIENTLRLPLVPAREETELAIREEMKRLKEDR